MPLHVLTATGRLARLHDRLTRVVQATASTCAARLALDPSTVDVVVRDAPQFSIPEIGVGGFNPDPYTIFVSVDPEHPVLQEALEAHVAASVAHEFHHVARRRGPGYGETLLGALVSEGLATQFAIEVTGSDPPPWATALSDDDAACLFAEARPTYHSAYDHRRWFFGSDLRVPRWAGYSLGFRLVRRYLEAHRYETAGSLARTPPDAFG